MAQPQAQQFPYQVTHNATGAADQFSAQFDPDNFPTTSFDPGLFPAGFTDTQSGTRPSNLLPQTPSNQLVRRNTNQQLTTRNATPSREQWMSPAQDTGTAWEVNDSDQDLDRKAALAKKDAQVKRKQIYPFVLKLWSFLHDNKNTDLIRWTDNGTAFTVLDEDEFARTPVSYTHLTLPTKRIV